MTCNSYSEAMKKYRQQTDSRPLTPLCVKHARLIYQSSFLCYGVTGAVKPDRVRGEVTGCLEDTRQSTHHKARPAKSPGNICGRKSCEMSPAESAGASWKSLKIRKGGSLVQFCVPKRTKSRLNNLFVHRPNG